MDHAMREAFVELAEIVRAHLSDHEEKQGYIAFGPEPSHRVQDLIDRIKGETAVTSE